MGYLKPCYIDSYSRISKQHETFFYIFITILFFLLLPYYYFQLFYYIFELRYAINLAYYFFLFFEKAKTLITELGYDTIHMRRYNLKYVRL